MAEHPCDARIVIIGGGVIGLSVAYHLAELGVSDVVLLERNTLTSGTSWHAAGIVGPLRANMNLTRLSIYATELFARLEEETGQATGYRRTGGLWLAQTGDRMTELARIAAMGEMNGLDVAMLDPAETALRAPLMRVDDLAGALWVAEDGQVNPVDLCMAYAKGARAGGVRICEGVGVAKVDTSGGRVRSVETLDGETIRCDVVVNCAGVWSHGLGAASGVPVPVQAVEHMYVVTEPIDGLPQPFPVLRDLEARIYIKEDAGKLVLGGFEPHAKPWDADGEQGTRPFLVFPDDWDQFEPFMTAGLNRIPAFETAGIQTFMNGPEGFTPDTSQAMGETPFCRNYFVAAGFNSIGIVSSAGAGRVMAEWIADGEAPMDLWAVDVARFAPHMATRAFMGARVREAVANQFEMHWPYKQMRTGRDRRRTPLHEAFAARGAVFGAPADWERPLWFAETANERSFAYSYGAQCWWPMAEREAKRLQSGVCLFELSPFGKFRVEGAGACALLQRLCAGDVDVEPGRIVYTQMLNRRGGIEADVTVVRHARDSFRVIGAAATRYKDLARLRQGRHDDDRIEIRDITGAYAVIGVMGPHARAVLAGLTDADLAPGGFGFATSRRIDLAGVPVRASRVSFVGELGWEIYVPSAFAVHVHAALCAAGADFGLAHAGHFCLDACRMEKGFRHWGHDIGPDDSPYEAGLSFCVALDKGHDFIGRDALLRQRKAGVTRRLVQFAVTDGHPLLLHDEPILRDGERVGATTSGARGFRTGLSLCLGYVRCAPGETARDLLTGAYEVCVAGERIAVTALARPPYDPSGSRMRS
jgi:4-methylaminobutanoate oxidase (formaldehyde-forming)